MKALDRYGEEEFLYSLYYLQVLHHVWFFGIVSFANVTGYQLGVYQDDQSPRSNCFGLLKSEQEPLVFCHVIGAVVAVQTQRIPKLDTRG
jgi:hypothetical protein